MPDKAHLETARIVLALDTAIVAFRAGESSDVRALDSASRLLDDLEGYGVPVVRQATSTAVWSNK